MTQLDEGHDLLHAQNKDRNYQSQKVKFLEDRIATLEKTVANLIKRYAEIRTWQEENFRGEENAE